MYIDFCTYITFVFDDQYLKLYAKITTVLEKEITRYARWSTKVEFCSFGGASLHIF